MGREGHRWVGMAPGRLLTLADGIFAIAMTLLVLAFVNPLISLLIYLALSVLFIAFNPVDRYFERLREDEV